MTPLGVVIVTYNAQDVICDCLETLFASRQDLRVVVVDNASTDRTTAIIETWQQAPCKAHAKRAFPFVTTPAARPVKGFQFLQSGRNGGFAAGVNIGLAHLLRDPAIDRVWILNPDTVVPPDTPRALASAPLDFALMGNRILYADNPGSIQIDAGTLNRWTGATGNINLGKPQTATKPDLTQAAFISGASMVASRPFIERAGLMPEEYFLYYEEVDWAMRRGSLPLAFCDNAPVYHLAGTAIGSPTLRTPASAFSIYHKHRARMTFLRKYYPAALPTGYLYGLAKTGRHLWRSERHQAVAAFRALHGMPLSADVAADMTNQTVQPGV